jgi:ANTAR domain-containing protein
VASCRCSARGTSFQGATAPDHGCPSNRVNSTGSIRAFDPHARETAAELASYAAVTLFNAALYAGPRRSRTDAAGDRRPASIEQAKGIIMAQQHCTADEAFRILIDTSSRSNRKLRHVAQTIISEAITHD